MRESIESKWDDLHGKVMKVFDDSAAMAYAGWPSAEADNALGQPPAIAVADVFEPAAIEGGENAEPPTIWSAEIVESVAATRRQSMRTLMTRRSGRPILGCSGRTLTRQ